MAGSELTYTMRFGSANRMTSTTSWCIPGTGRVGDDDIRTAVLVDEVLCQHVLHVAGKEQRVSDAVDLAQLTLASSMASGTYSMPMTWRACLGHEVGDGTRAGIEVVNQARCRSARRSCAATLYEVVCLLGVGLVERLGTHLEAQSLHLLEDVVFALERVHLEVGDGVVALIINNV